MRIRHDNSGRGPGWFLEKVIVRELKTNRVYEFPCHQWLADNEGDRKIEREYYYNEGIFMTVSFYRAMHVVLARYCYQKRLKLCIALHGKPISELRAVTCHMGSHSITCHPTQVNVPRLNPSQTGRYSIYLPQRDGRLS